MLFGNTSLQPGIRLMSFELPDSMYRHYPGPKFGRQGIRELCGIEKRPHSHVGTETSRKKCKRLRRNRL